MYKFVSVSKAPECGTIHTSLFFCYRGGSPETTSTPLFPHNTKTATQSDQNTTQGVCYSTITDRVCYSKSVLGCATSQWVHGNNKCMCMKVECARSACVWKQGYKQTCNYKRQTENMGEEKQKKKERKKAKLFPIPTGSVVFLEAVPTGSYREMYITN